MEILYCYSMSLPVDDEAFTASQLIVPLTSLQPSKRPVSEALLTRLVDARGATQQHRRPPWPHEGADLDTRSALGDGLATLAAPAPAGGCLAETPVPHSRNCRNDSLCSAFANLCQHHCKYLQQVHESIYLYKSLRRSIFAKSLHQPLNICEFLHSTQHILALSICNSSHIGAKHKDLQTDSDSRLPTPTPTQPPTPDLNFFLRVYLILFRSLTFRCSIQQIDLPVVVMKYLQIVAVSICKSSHIGLSFSPSPNWPTGERTVDQSISRHCYVRIATVQL